MRKDRVSVVITSYNHAEFIEEAIDSALSQSEAPAEVIVIDDASTDGTPELLKRYSKNVRVIRNPVNLGGAETTSRGIMATTGNLVAVLNSDDSWTPDKLAVQKDWLHEHSLDAVFSRARVFDANSSLMATPPSYFDVFQRVKPEFGGYLAHFFFLGNFLCHSSILAKRSIYERAGYYDNRLRQLPDLNQWIKFAKHGELGVVDENLVNYRYLGERNTSNAKSSEVLIRTRMEHALLFTSFFEGVESDRVKEEFEQFLPNPNSQMQKPELVSHLLWNHPDFSLSAPARLAAVMNLWSTAKSQKEQLSLHAMNGAFDFFHLLEPDRPLPSIRKILWAVKNRK